VSKEVLMIIAFVPLLIALIGLLMWALLAPTILKEVGRYLFIIGTFWSVYAVIGHTVKVL
jgi:hypothetical protein